MKTSLLKTLVSRTAEPGREPEDGLKVRTARTLDPVPCLIGLFFVTLTSLAVYVMCTCPSAE